MFYIHLKLFLLFVYVYIPSASCPVMTWTAPDICLNYICWVFGFYSEQRSWLTCDFYVSFWSSSNLLRSRIIDRWRDLTAAAQCSVIRDVVSTTNEEKRQDRRDVAARSGDEERSWSVLEKEAKIRNKVEYSLTIWFNNVHFFSSWSS